ncbi:MAG: LytTR family transcriptional regulator DNA-binding domain-containing protein [Bacteroidales bacterium]|nr:LytTR family transcriptional regulator DNA-binding domain-containing protein [Bacteroidales bacterium]
MINALIVEDEKLARDLIKDYLSEHTDINLLGEFADGFSGLKAINEMKPDLVFLDIQMPKLSGFELLEVLDHIPVIIFTTAFDQYAIKAFEFNAVDYLLKPYSKERFAEAVTKSREKINSGNREGAGKIVAHIDNKEDVIHRVVVKSRSRIHVIPVDDIRYLEAQDDYVMIYTREHKYLKQKTMKFFEAHLPPDDFVRIHRSYIARLSEIGQMELYEKDSYVVILKDSTRLPVSKTGLPKLKEMLDF